MSRFEIDELSNRPSVNQTKKGLAMDLVLALLGGSTIWLACRYFSFAESRPLHNAWTYVAAIPLGLIAVDLLLRTVVSRFVERTLQVAFLLSILVHLFLTMGAFNVLLFASRDSDLPTSLTSTVSSQEQLSSIPEYLQTSESTNTTKPDYLRPVETANAKALVNEADKQEIEHPSSLPTPAEIPDVTIETPKASLTKSKAMMDTPEIQSAMASLDRLEFSTPVPDRQQSIAIPKSKNLSDSDVSASLQASPHEFLAPKPKFDIASEVSMLDRLSPSPLTLIDEKRNVSKSLERRQKDHFELPAIEDRKTDLAKRDLSPENGAQLSESSMSRVPLLDVRKSVDGESVNQLPSTSIDRPSDIGEISRSTGNRKLDSTIGGSLSSAALDGWSEDGGLHLQSGKGTSRSATPLLSRNARDAEEVQISSPKGATPRVKPNRSAFSGGIGTSSNTAVPLPKGPTTTEQQPNNSMNHDSLVASNMSSENRVMSNSKSGLGETLRGPSLGLSDVQPSIDSQHAASRSLAAAGGRKSTLPGLEPSFDIPGLPGPKRLPRLPSAQPTPNAPAVPIPVPAFQQRMARNDGSADSTDLGEYGPATEAAIERGLEFLAKHQRADGSWRLEDFGDKPRLRSHTAATALSLLAFQGAGYSHRQYHYAPVCKSSLEFLLANQQPNGDLYIPADEASNANARFYSHSIASLALCEAYGMTQDEALREPAQRAVQFMVKTQDSVGGGWRYQPGFESDTSVSGWFMMALKSAELSGLDVPAKTFDNIKGWLEKAQASPEERHLYRYNPLAPDTPVTRHGRIPNPTMTGVGLLMRLYLGWRRDTADMMRGADYLLENLPAEGTPLNPKRDTYYWYYATQVLFHMGGERWKQWNSQLHPLLIRSQQLEGDQLGSWNPAGPIPDRWGPFAGRLYVTTLNLLSLEVYYRHLPIYEDTAR